MKETLVSEEFQEEYFQQALALAEEAQRTGESASVLRLLIAGTRFDLFFGSKVLRDHFAPSVLHLQNDESAECDPDYRIFVWDSLSSGLKMLPPPGGRSDFTDRGDIWGFQSNRFRYAFHYGDLSLNLFDRDSKIGVYWVDNPAHIPYWSKAAPFRTLFQWCLELDGFQLLHAAAIGNQNGAVLLTGPGGSGKSTTAITGVCCNMNYAGDDYVIVKHGSKSKVSCLYNSAKIHFNDVQSFESICSLTSYEEEYTEKQIFHLFPDLKEQICQGMEIKAILVPKINSEGVTTISSPYNSLEVVHAASFSTVSQLPYSGKPTYDYVTNLVTSLPSYMLELGANRKEIVKVIESLINDPSSYGQSVGLVKASNYPSLSVIIPVYNREKIILETLENIVSQDYPDIEIIVVNDGSEDKTEEVLKNAPYDVRYFSQPNIGPSGARNRGVINSHTEFIAFLDSDDLWPDGMLKLLIEQIKDLPAIDVVKGYGQLAYRNDSEHGYKYIGNPGESFPDYITGTVFRRKVFERVGLFDKDLRFGEDIDWFNKAREAGIRIKQLDCTSVIVRRHSANMTKGKNLVELNVLRVFKKALDRKRMLQKRHNFS